MSGRVLLLASAFVAALAALPAGKAAAASWLEKNFYLSGPQYEGKLPPCDYRDALVLIASRFNQKENMYWATDLRIVNFERIRETAFRPWAANAIPRRFCSGVVGGRARPQLVLQSGLQDGAAVDRDRATGRRLRTGLGKTLLRTPACRLHFHFVLEMFTSA